MVAASAAGSGSRRRGESAPGLRRCSSPRCVVRREERRRRLRAAVLGRLGRDVAVRGGHGGGGGCSGPGEVTAVSAAVFVGAERCGRRERRRDELRVAVDRLVVELGAELEEGVLEKLVRGWSLNKRVSR